MFVTKEHSTSSAQVRHVSGHTERVASADNIIYLEQLFYVGARTVWNRKFISPDVTTMWLESAAFCMNINVSLDQKY